MHSWLGPLLISLALIPTGCSRDRRRPPCAEPSACKAACDGGRMDACGSYAARVHLTATTRAEIDQATALAKRACDAGAASACSTVATWVPRARKDEAEAKNRVATGRFEAECREGWIESCDALALRLRNGDGIAKDEARASTLTTRVVAAYRRATDAGAADDCANLASALRDAGDEALAAIDKACSLGNATACVRAAQEHKDDLRGPKWLGAACERGDAVGCEMLAERGGRPAAAERAVSLHVAACEEGRSSGCEAAIRLFEQGKLVPADRERARQLAARMRDRHIARCDAGLGWDCEAAAGSFEYPTAGLPRSARRAQELLARACELGEPTPCQAKKTLVEGLVALAMERFHGCGLGRDGDVRCWGVNSSGELGDDTTQSTLRKPRKTTFPRAKSVAVAASATCVVHDEGAVTCAGRPLGQSLGSSPRRPVVTEPVSSIALGARHGCLLQRTGRVVCLGSQLLTGALGDGTRDDATDPRPVKGLPDKIDAIFAGEGASCARAGEKVFCWGNAPEVPAHDRLAKSEATRFPALDGATSLAIGRFGTCAVFASGKVGCLARPERPLGRHEAPPAPARLDDVSGITDAVEVTVGRAHACARSRAGAVQCWGEAGRAQLGGPGTPPVRVPDLVATTVVAAEDRTCALEKDTGALVCWGDDQPPDVVTEE